jgi:gas vesicle protein
MGKAADEMRQKDEYSVESRSADANDLVDEQLQAKNAPQPEEQVTEIRESIEQTRANMTETIDELQERLSPSHLKEQVIEQYKQARETVREATIGKVEDMVDRVSDTMYETRRSIVDTVTGNPIPSALVGIGLAWLWMNRRNDSGSARSRYDDRYRGAPRYDEFGPRYRSGSSGNLREHSGERSDFDTDASGHVANSAGNAVSEVAGQIQGAASNLAGKARATVSGVVDQAQESAGHFAEVAQHQAQRVEERFNAALRENPLAIGAVALALGTAVGLAVPQTRKEHEWMGEARDTLVDKAQSVASEAMDNLQQVAQKVSDEIAPGNTERSQSPQSGTL